MEPMNLGSPVGSPAATQHAPPVSNSVNTFIAPYLMGDFASPSAASGGRVVCSGSASPNKTTTRQFSTSTVSTPSSPQPSKEPFFPSRLGQDKQCGPPTQGLMGLRSSQTLPHSPLPSQLCSPYIDHIQGTPGLGYGSNPGTPGLGYGSNPGTPVAGIGFSTPLGLPTQNTSITTPRDLHTSLIGQDSQMYAQELLEDTWITVFGFPAPAASYILTQFAQLGTIIETKNPGTGNWLHLKYQTKLQARKALTKNGKIFSGNIMVGVVPCSDKTLTGDKENISTANISNLMSPHNTSLPGTPKTSMRPLTQAYQTAHSEHEVLPKVNTPKKSEGIVAKAMQHILGL